MQGLKKLLMVGSLTLLASPLFAAPSSMTTHNKTSHQSNAYISGFPSPYPVEAHKDRSISWTLVKAACFFKTQCSAEVFMETETSKKVSIGKMTMNTSTGAIDPMVLDTDKYHLEVNGPGEVTITEK